MFAQEYRLDRPAFMHVLSKGRRIHMPSLSLVYLPAVTRRSAVVVGKKVSTSAVVRNTLKRRVSTALYELQSPPGQYIVVMKPIARTYSYARLQTELATSLSRAFGQQALSR